MKTLLIDLSIIFGFLIIFCLSLFVIFEFGLLGVNIVGWTMILLSVVQIFRWAMALFPNETRMKAALMVLSSFFGGSLIFGLWFEVLFKFGFLYFCIMSVIIALFIAVSISRCKTPLFRFEETWWWRQN